MISIDSDVVNKAVNILDKNFPKDKCKEREEAMVMYAELFFLFGQQITSAYKRGKEDGEKLVYDIERGIDSLKKLLKEYEELS